MLLLKRRRHPEGLVTAEPGHLFCDEKILNDQMMKPILPILIYICTTPQEDRRPAASSKNESWTTSLSTSLNLLCGRQCAVAHDCLANKKVYIFWFSCCLMVLCKMPSHNALELVARKPIIDDGIERRLRGNLPDSRGGDGGERSPGGLLPSALFM